MLFLDVDGPLIPFGPSGQRAAHRHRGGSASGAGTSAGPGPGPRARAGSANPLLERLDPAVGPRLAALDCELVWASTWRDDANDAVAPLLGLPRLPVVDWPAEPTGGEPADEEHTDEGPRGLHWKTRHIVAWAGRRPFIWVDDEIGAVDRLWVSAQHDGQSLLHRVDSGEALTDDDFAVLDRWLRDLRAGQL